MSIVIKNKEQIDGIRKSCRLAAETLRFLKPYVIEGVSTQKLNDLADTFIRDHKAIPAPLNYKGFPKSVCTSINEVVCHGIPSEKDVLKNGDIINIDVTTILDGYYGDTCTMYSVGEVSSEASELLKTTQECLDIGINQVKPGNKFSDIAYQITKHAYNKGYGVVYQFCGHGTGLQFHEEPRICHSAFIEDKDIRKMKPGHIFTIEPMINLGTALALIDESDGWTARTKDGKLSAQYEHTVLVTETGVEILTV